MPRVKIAEIRNPDSELPEIVCPWCDAVFTVIYNRSIDTEEGVAYCPFCGCEFMLKGQVPE